MGTPEQQTPRQVQPDWFERLHRLANWLNPPSQDITDEELADPGRMSREGGSASRPGGVPETPPADEPRDLRDRATGRGK